MKARFFSGLFVVAVLAILGLASWIWRRRRLTTVPVKVTLVVLLTLSLTGLAPDAALAGDGGVNSVIIIDVPYSELPANAGEWGVFNAYYLDEHENRIEELAAACYREADKNTLRCDNITTDRSVQVIGLNYESIKIWIYEGSSQMEFPYPTDRWDEWMHAVGEQPARGGGAGPATWSITGVPATASNVLVAQCPDTWGNCFQNTISLGSEMLLAEPGTLLVGPDFPAETVKNSGGAIQYINPLSQYLLETEGPSYVNVSEGQFAWLTGATMRVQIDNLNIHLEGREAHNWFLLIRGIFADGKQDTDLNRTATVTEYVAGHIQVMIYPPGAFVSEGNFKQVAELSHTGGTNVGAEGGSGLSVMFVDLNTKAYAIIYQANIGQPWQLIARNW